MSEYDPSNNGPQLPPPGQPVPPPPQPGYQQPGPPPPSGPQQPYGGQQPYGAPQEPGTDGVSVAALITGILFMGLIPLILGIIGMKRTKDNGTNGRGFAIAGVILGALSLVLGIVLAIAAIAGALAFGEAIEDLEDTEFNTTVFTDAETYGDDPELDALWDACAAGDEVACDDLYWASPIGSEYEEFGQTCAYMGCSGDTVDTDVDNGLGGDAFTYGDDPELDALWDSCAAGNDLDCDTLYSISPFGSEYEEFGDTCGGRGREDLWCDPSNN